MTINKNNRDDRYTSFNRERHQSRGGKSREIVIVPENKQAFLYIINTCFLLIIAFVAGYNLKAYQVQKSANSVILAAGEYIQNAEAIRLKTLAAIETLKSQEVRHYEGVVHEKGTESMTAGVTSSEPVVMAEPTANKTDTEMVMPAEARGKSAPIKETVSKTVRLEKPLKQSAPPVDGVTIVHTVEEGEVLSMLVRKAHVNYFLETNPHIANPDLIHTGQKLRILIPNRNLETGVYMDNYFIKPTAMDGNTTYRLLKWLLIPESDSMLGYIIKQPKIRINRATIPYINMVEFSNTMKEEIHNEKLTGFNRKNKIEKVIKSQNGIKFHTIRKHPAFKENTYLGVHLTKSPDYNANIYILKQNLIKYLVHPGSGTDKDGLFHFMIFDRTIVQTDYLDEKCINRENDKSKIRIGVVYQTNKTENAVFGLQSTLTNCKAETGEIVEVDMTNMARFKK